MPTDVSWEEMFERVASEVGRASETWNERMASEVERVVQKRSPPPPVPTANLNRATQEDLCRLDARVEAGFRAFSREIVDLKEWANAALSTTCARTERSSMGNSHTPRSL